MQITPTVFAALQPYGGDATPVSDLALNLVAAFAARAGGIATDAWTALPTAMEGLPADSVAALFAEVEQFLERGGSVALHVLLAGSGILRQVPAVFPDWLALLRTLSPHGNASLIAVVRETPRFLQELGADELRPRASDLALRVIHAVHRVAQLDAESALACFESSLRALRFATIDQFEEWVDNGLQQLEGAEAKARRSYFALETRRSFERLSAGGSGLALDQVQQTLRLYVEGLTGRAVEIAPLSAVPVETRLGDGRTIHLPSAVNEFGDEDLDFRLYKVLAAHAAGQIEFGTYEKGGADLRAAFKELDQTYPLAGEKDPEAFSYGDVPPAGVKVPKTRSRRWPKDGDYRTVLPVFPNPPLARRIFATLENGRIDRRLRHEYRGLARDLDLTVAHIREHRPKLSDLPPSLAAFELLFQIAMLGGALADSRELYGAVEAEIQEVADYYLAAPDATVADTVMATWRRGRELIREHNRAHAVELPLFLDAVFVHPPQRVGGTAVFLCAVAGITPNALLHSLKHYKVLHTRNLFVSVRNHEVPWVAPNQRLEIVDLGNDCWRVTLHYGFKDHIDLPGALNGAVNQVGPIDPMLTSYFLSATTIVPHSGGGMALWREKLYTRLHLNASPMAEFLRLPVNAVVELGTQIEI